MRNLIDILELSTEEIDELILRAEDIISNPDAYREKENSWQRILPTVSFNVKADVCLRRIGQESSKSAL